MHGESEDIQDLLDDLRRGDPKALESLWSRYQKQLLRLVAFRLDASLRRSVSITEVLQEVHGEAQNHLSQFQTDLEVPFFVWLRTVTVRRLGEIHRQHLGAAARETAEGAAIEASPEKIAEYLDYLTRPSHVAPRGEAIARLREHFDQLDALDRELLALRLFEVWSENEAAALLGIEPVAASVRYARALEFYKEAAQLLPAFEDPEELD
jgi:RNA polymerase sigma-70 factor (ECF subfamily)